MGRRATAVLVTGLLVLTGALVGLPTLMWWQSRAAADGPSSMVRQGDGYGSAPSFVLTDQNGRRVSSAQLDGKVQVVSFLFPYCTSYCPEIARQMTVLQAALAGTPLAHRVEIVAFNVDPAGAGPGRMRQFWSEFGGDPSSPDVEFLTGTPAQIRHVVTDGYHVSYEKVSQASETAGGDQPEVRSTVAEQAHVDYDIVHNDFLDIVGPHGRVRQILDHPTQLSDGALLAAVKEAATAS
ncbi:MAG TPA: SCO family protein [Angustibacter sp.]|nr:SCO family protein [Angustibacter sp.]